MDELQKLILSNEEVKKYIMSQRWWVMALRGVCALIFGALAFIRPESALLALAILFGAYAFVSGVMYLASALGGGAKAHRCLFFLQGLLGIAAGIVVFFYPLLGEQVVLLLIIFWAIFTGVLEMAAAFKLPSGTPGKGMLGLGGGLSLLFGILLFTHPAAGMFAIVWLVGIYAVFFGVLLLLMSGTLKKLQQKAHDGDGSEKSE